MHEAEVKKYVRTLAQGIVKDNQLKQVGEARYEYLQRCGIVATINTATKICTCFTYADKAVCKHLVAACILDKVRMPGLEVFPKRLLKMRYRRQKQYLDHSLIYENEEIEMPNLIESNY